MSGHRRPSRWARFWCRVLGHREGAEVSVGWCVDDIACSRCGYVRRKWYS